MGDDAQQNRPTRRQYDRVVPRQLFVEHEDREDDRGEPARAKPPDKELVGSAGSRADQA